MASTLTQDDRASGDASLFPFPLAHDPAAALNAHARAHGWSFECDTTLGFDHPDLQGMREVWRTFCKPGRLPARTELSIQTLKRYVRQISIFEVVENDGQWRYLRKLVATAIAERLGGASGGFLDEFLPPPLYEKAAPYLDAVVDHRCPLRLVAEFVLPAVSFLHGEAFLLPLAEDGTTPNMVMAAAYFSVRPNP